MSTAENVSHLFNLRGADGTALPEVIADYFGGRDLEEEDLGMFTFFSQLTRVN